MIQKYDLIIFDCDGTLVDSHDMNHQIMADIANQYGDLSYSLESVEKEYLGIDYTKFFKMVEEREGVTIPDDAPKQCVQMALEKIPTMMHDIEGVHETLERLNPHYKMNVASNASRPIVLKSLEATRLNKFFDVEKIMAGRAMAAPKPAPDLFLEAAKNMGVTPERTLVIEDSATGVQAARAAGMDVWVSTAVARDRESQEIILKEAGAERVFSTFIHIAEALNL